MNSDSSHHNNSAPQHPAMRQPPEAEKERECWRLEHLPQSAQSPGVDLPRLYDVSPIIKIIELPSPTVDDQVITYLTTLISERGVPYGFHLDYSIRVDQAFRQWAETNALFVEYVEPDTLDDNLQDLWLSVRSAP